MPHCVDATAPATMAGPIQILVRRLASRVLLDRDLMPTSGSETNDERGAAPDAAASLPISPSTSAMWTLLGLLIGVAIVLLSLWRRHRRARRLLEGGRCNLPTVIWRPRFVNYAPDQDDNHDDDDGCTRTHTHTHSLSLSLFRAWVANAAHRCMWLRS